MFHDRSQRQGGKKGQRPDHDRPPRSEAHKERRVGRQAFPDRPAPSFCAPRSCECQCRDRQPETGDQHRQATGQVVKRRIGVQTPEGAAVVVTLRSIGIENFAETMRAGIENGRRAGLSARPPGP